MIRRLGQRVALGLLLLASAGAAQAAPATVNFNFSAAYTGQVDGSVPTRNTMHGQITVTVAAFNKGFDFRFNNSDAYANPDGSIFRTTPLVDETDGLLGFRVTFNGGEMFSGNFVDLAYLRDVQIGRNDTLQTKAFSLQGSAKTGLTGSFHFNDDNHMPYGKILGVNLAFSGWGFSGDAVAIGTGCDAAFDPCLFSGPITAAMAVPAPGGVALLALGVLGLGLVRRGQASA
ncbi:hypothetical protein [Sabulicella glaciei]|uniref:VPLPA-CTERM sorting domain-containing protein n=1 Tax=Sabulicella glaciei TaxID=2984948 RepID=A0ABT3NT32_9PROT|nr:hypothetical protein [Roseococcus sp. MDT2-1-1]MCW8084714.1 hypothetical protein [Roseococcus sp. MDT2-1-1]